MNERARQDGKYERWLADARKRRHAQRVAKSRPCPYCNTPMTNPRRVQCGQTECRRRFQADRMIEWQRRHKEQSGQWYHRKYADQQREYEQSRRARSGHWRHLYPEAAAASDARRRMLVQQARTGEVFSPHDVHTRDRWTCRLCWLPIDPGTAWPDPMSPSIDHVIPLSRGGAHAMANVQSAHLGCNSGKGDKLISEVIERLRSKSKSQ